MIAPLLIVLFGCRHPVGPETSVEPRPTGPALVDYVKLGSTVSWRESIVLEGAVGFDVQVRQQWSPPVVDETGRTIYTVSETETVNGESRVRETYQMVLATEGFGYGATQHRGEALAPWEPPKWVLPRNPSVGEHWEADHAQGARSVHRACDLQTSSLCRDGLTSVCETRSGEAITVVREHFCPGVGWSGYESLHVQDGRTERRWSEDLVRTPR